VAVRINGTDLIQILLNLAVNGFQCSLQKHSVGISGQYMANPVNLSGFEENGEQRFLNREGFKNNGPLLAIAVSDTGPGIPADILPKIFDPYFTTKAASQGTGLGLNVVQRLVKEAKAGLHVRTRSGVGTTFTVYLPVT
jgi:signal transduction histidine kinase